MSEDIRPTIVGGIFSPRRILGRLLRLPLRLLPADTFMRIPLGALSGTKWVIRSTSYRCLLGIYELETQLALRRILRPANTVYDLGAGVGFFTILASRLVGDQGKVVAFEPFPRNLELLRVHLRYNGISNATVVPMAVADKPGVALFQAGEYSSMGRLSDRGTLRVDMTSLDEYWSTEGGSPPDLIKIDIEGAELQALQGAKELLSQARPIMIIACHTAALHRQCCIFLRSLDYSLTSTRGGPAAPGLEILATPEGQHVADRTAPNEIHEQPNSSISSA
jgi:FkbM family methyltransferase